MSIYEYSITSFFQPFELVFLFNYIYISKISSMFSIETIHVCDEYNSIRVSIEADGTPNALSSLLGCK